MDAGRSRLLTLSPSEIAELLASLPNLHVMWARPAKVADNVLAEGQVKALRAVQVNLRRDSSAFHNGLAWSSITNLVGDAQDGSHSPEMLAEEAGKVLGPDLGEFVINIVAESNFPIAEAVRARLDELVGIASRQGRTNRDVVEPEPLDPSEDDDIPPDDLADLIGQIDLPDDLEDVVPGPSIADEIRAVADRIAAGETPTESMADVLARASDWSSQEATRAVLEARSGRLDELSELAETVASLQSGGKEKFAAMLLDQHGFESFAELTKAIVELEGEVASPAGPVALENEPALPPADSPVGRTAPKAATHANEAVEPEVDPIEPPHEKAAPIEPLPSTKTKRAPEVAKPSPEPAPNIPGDPWADGQIASLLSDERELLAVVAAESLGVADYRVRMLRLFAGAFGSRTDALLVQEPDLVLDGSSDVEYNADENRLLFAAHSRLALELGFSPVGSLERFRQAAALEDHPAGEFAAEVARLATRGFKRPFGTVALSALPDDWRNYAEAVERKRAALESTSLTYQRASRIIHYLARTNQRIGGALERCASLARLRASGQQPGADEVWDVVDSLLKDLRDPQSCERLLNEADQAVSTPQQKRKSIIASARDRLQSLMAEVADVLEEGLALRARAEGSGAVDDPQGMANLVAIGQQVGELQTRPVGDVAIRRLVDWILADVVAVQTSSPLAQQLAEELLPLFEIPRDENGLPARAVPSPTELQSLIEGRDPLTVIEGYLEVGNVEAAQLLQQSRPSNIHAADEERIALARQSRAREHDRTVAEIDRVLDHLRSLDDDDLVRQLTQELVDVAKRRKDIPGRFDLHAVALTSIRDRGDARLAEVRDDLRARAARLDSPEDTSRILELLESGENEQLAVDYITLAEDKKPLPVLEAPAGDDFGDFFPAVVRVAEGAKRDRAVDNMIEVQKHIGPARTPTHRMLGEGLKAWNDLVVDGRLTQLTPARLANVLRMLGLVPADDRKVKELTKERHAGYVTYEVKANPIDRSYVPSFGSQARGSYDVTIVWEERSPKTLLSHVEMNRKTEANVILYLRTLSVDQRLELRKLTARAGFVFSPLVIDMPVIAWLSRREEPSWRVTQRVTLPFTTLNPYAPFAGGEVPDEVFVGREAERHEIIDPTGSMFVYGGRQLGKSALLRRVERGLMSQQGTGLGPLERGHVAVYLDLKSEGIGESTPPSALWGALASRLTKVGVLPASGSTPTADAVTGGILDWLEADNSRRLLLLLDEADNFLTLDAQGGPGQGSFPVLQKLKGVMERTGRRFKPVFAGLHQVQRFHGLPNTPVVHGGRDILIGPLSSVDARELVRDPLFALGYDFETPDTMWRLLRLTNYQASLIQIICEALVRHMLSSELPRAGGRIVIKARDVDDVYAKRDVRDLITQRFRWTINLDNRYKVIALVTALRSLEAKAGERFRASELHDDCERFWPAGFSRSTLSSAEFFRYLDEMQGLGVLHRQGEDEFGLRSPSILGLIGSRETIEEELLEASDQLEVEHQYNPAVNRRILDQDAAGAETRSPLPDSELAALLKHAPNEPRVKVVAGTRALGLHHVARALEKAAPDHAVRLVTGDVLTLRDQLTGANDDTHLVIDLTSESESSRRAALGVLAEGGDAYVTVVLRAEDLPVDAQTFGEPVLLRRWSLEGLQSLESPFARSDLQQVTGGWPDLVEKATSDVIRGAKTERAALDAIQEALRDPHAARTFLADTGVPIEVARTWLDWFASDGDTGELQFAPASNDDLDAAFERDSRPAVDLLQRLDAVDEVPGGWKLDRAVAVAARHAEG